MTEASLQPPKSLIPKTAAKELFCVSDKELQGLNFIEKPLKRFKRLRMKLYDQEEVKALAMQKFGDEAKLEEARHDRLQKRIKRSHKRVQEMPARELRTDTPLNEAFREEMPQEVSQESSQVLHPFIQERIRHLHDGFGATGQYVLYWMRTALRTHENPALDVARNEARRRGLPLLLCAFVLTEGHPHPTLRRMKFYLEGLQDLQLALQAQGERLHVFVEGHSQLNVPNGVDTDVNVSSDMGEALPGQALIDGVIRRTVPPYLSGWRALMHTASKAALVITEEMPVEPEAQWSRKLVEEAGRLGLSVWAVDTACLLPMKLFKKPFEKAWAYRSASAALRAEHLRSMPYQDLVADWNAYYSRLESFAEEATGRGEEGPSPGWEGVDLRAPDLDIEALLRGCPGVDCSVSGVTHMLGGSKQANLRWESFRNKDLAFYAARRNSPMNRDGVSRLSAYHHFGMISPFLVAREAARNRCNGASKLLDEFLTWRELAYVWCFHHLPTSNLFSELPEWARKTLLQHAADPRLVKPLTDLEAGATGDLLWDAMQHQLLTTGELHNNARMTWGKAILLWTPDPKTALDTLIHINNKFSLDGCDPASYGGVLWCFGLFDKPMGRDSTLIYGSLRQRTTDYYARRLNAGKFKDLPVNPLLRAVTAVMETGQTTLDVFFLRRQQSSQS